MTNPLKGVTFPGLPGEFQIPQTPEDIGAASAEEIIATGTKGIASSAAGVTDANELPAGIWKGNNLANAPEGMPGYVLYHTYYYNAAQSQAWQAAYYWTTPGSAMMRTKTSDNWGPWHSFAPSVGDEWDSTKTYAVGDYCIYRNALYRCKVQHVNQAPTSTTYWTATTLVKELGHDYDNATIVGTRGEKFVYRKYVEVSLASLTATTAYTAYTLPHGIANVDKIIDYSFAAYSTTHTNSYPLPYFVNGTTATYVESVNPTNIIMRNTAAWGSGYAVAGFIYYTLK